MKIQGIHGINPYHKVAEGNQEKRPVANLRHDQLQISEEAKRLLASQQEENQGDVERTEKIQQLKERIDGGTYDVPTQELAKRLQFLLKGRE